jgi:hypothetical protein
LVKNGFVFDGQAPYVRSRVPTEIVLSEAGRGNMAGASGAEEVGASVPHVAANADCGPSRAYPSISGLTVGCHSPFGSVPRGEATRGQGSEIPPRTIGSPDTPNQPLSKRWSRQRRFATMEHVTLRWRGQMSPRVRAVRGLLSGWPHPRIN